VGNLEPKEDKNAQSGPGFQIQINLGGQSLSLGSTQPRMLENPPIDILEIPLEGEE